MLSAMILPNGIELARARMQPAAMLEAAEGMKVSVAMPSTQSSGLSQVLVLPAALRAVSRMMASRMLPSTRSSEIVRDLMLPAALRAVAERMLESGDGEGVDDPARQPPQLVVAVAEM